MKQLLLPVALIVHVNYVEKFFAHDEIYMKPHFMQDLLYHIEKRLRYIVNNAK